MRVVAGVVIDSKNKTYFDWSVFYRMKSSAEIIIVISVYLFSETVKRSYRFY